MIYLHNFLITVYFQKIRISGRGEEGDMSRYAKEKWVGGEWKRKSAKARKRREKEKYWKVKKEGKEQI